MRLVGQQGKERPRLNKTLSAHLLRVRDHANLPLQVLKPRDGQQTPHNTKHKLVNWMRRRQDLRRILLEHFFQR